MFKPPLHGRICHSATAMDTLGKKDLAGRLADVFGALGSSSWNLGAPAPFQAGREVAAGDSAGDSDDEEAGVGAQVMPQALIDSDEPGCDTAADQGGEEEDMGEGEEDEGGPRSVCHTGAFRRQFEQEEEEDEYDRFADEGWNGLPSGGKSYRPPGTTEVLDEDDDVHDVMGSHGKGQRLTGAIQAQHHKVSIQDMDTAPMEVEQGLGAAQQDELPDLIPSTSNAPSTSAPQPKATDQAPIPPQRRSVFDRLERPANRPAPPAQPALKGATQEAVAPGHGAQQGGSEGRGRQGKRVRFNDQGVDDRPHPGDDSAPRDRQQGGGGGRGGRGGRGRPPVLNWQRPGYVPDHVKHPERYTVYDLGEELTVGGGEKGRSSAAAAEAAILRQAVANTQVVAVGNTSGGDAAAAVEEERAPLPVGSGVVRFTPRVQRQGINSDAPAVPATGPTPMVVTASQSVNQPSKPVLNMTYDAPETIDPNETSAPSPAFNTNNNRQGARRQFRSKGGVLGTADD